MVLVSSNPTNLVLSGAFSISFTKYTAHVFLPFLAAAVLVFPVLLFLFRTNDLIPRSIDITGVHGAINPTSVLVDKNGAVFGGSLLLVTLGVLVGTSTIGVPVWQVTVPPAVIMLCRDIYHDLYRAQDISSNENPAEQAVELRKIPTGSAEPVSPNQESLPVSRSFQYLSSVSFYTSRFPTITSVLRRLPVALLPFAFLMFILVQGLTTKGWVELLAKWWSHWVTKTGPVGAVAGMGLLSCILCNVSSTITYKDFADRVCRFVGQISEQPSSPLECCRLGF